MAFQILGHTLRLLFGNFGQVLRVSVGPYLIFMLCLALFARRASNGQQTYFDPFTSAIIAGPDRFTIIGALLLFALFILVIAWIAVSWHRFILRGERSGLLPAISGRPILPYAAKALLLGLLMFLLAMALSVVIGTLLSSMVLSSFEDITLSPDGIPQFPLTVMLLNDLTPILVSLPIYYLSLRFGVALVGTALGKPLGFRAAWGATARIGWVILGLAVVVWIIDTVTGVALLILKFNAPVVGDGAQLVITWFMLMLGISILTTLYGYAVENRTLVIEQPISFKEIV